MTEDRNVAGYSATQVTLHWVVVVLVAFQFVAHDGIEASWDAFVHDLPVPLDKATLTNLHIASGIAVLPLALIRIFLRVTRGTPAPPADEPKFLQFISEAVHKSIYALLLLLPVSGAAAWFFEVEAAGQLHEFLTTLLLGAISLHVAGALFQHFIRRSDVMMRMLLPERRE